MISLLINLSDLSEVNLASARTQRLAHRPRRDIGLVSLARRLDRSAVVIFELAYKVRLLTHIKDES